MLSVPEHLKGRDFLRVADWSRDELLAALDLADRLKQARRDGENHRVLPGRPVGDDPAIRASVLVP